MINKRRIFKKLQENNEIVNNNIVINQPINYCYIPYLFDYNEGRQISNIIKKYILMNLYNVKKIVNVYQPYYKDNVPATGLGDYIRGSIFLHQYCKIANIEFEMNMDNHMISSILDNKYSPIGKLELEKIEHFYIQNYHPNIINFKDINIYINEINNINNYLSKCIINKNGILYVFIKSYPFFQITNDDKEFIKNSLKYNKEFEKELNRLKEIFNLVSKKYNIIHVRTGDKYLIDNNFISDNFINKINKLIEEYINNNRNKKIVLIGDSNNLLNIIVNKYKSLINFNNIISHTGEGVISTLESIKNNMKEFFIMSESSSILSLSTYYHGSGFSKWCAEIYDIPYNSIYIN